MTEIDANGAPSTPIAKYQWDPLSRQTLITYGDGTTDSYSRYDAGDNLNSLNQNFAGGSSVTFSYGYLKDHKRQSTLVNNPAFQYMPTPTTIGYAAADLDNGYTNVGGANLTYDGNHNLTYDGFNTLTFDVENRLIQAQNSVSTTVQYLYDSLGHRKQKQVNSVLTQFVLVGSEEIADFSGAGVGTAQILTVRGVRGLPVAAITPSTGTIAYYHHDVHGSTVAMSEAGTNGPAEMYTYDDFGSASGGGFATYRYAGYRYDIETGLYYVRARYYSPQIGRFLQPDPIGYVGGRNLYTYVRNDPVNLADPLGTCGNPQGCGTGILGYLENHPGQAVGGALLATAAIICALTPCVVVEVGIGVTGGGAAVVTGIGVTVTSAGAVAGTAATGGTILLMSGQGGDTGSDAGGDTSPTPPSEQYPTDPTQPPGPGYEWRGQPGSVPGDPNGNWYNPNTGESLRPDLSHPDPIGPHWDYRAPDGQWYRWYPNGQVIPKG
jgi:RHS repeat-associated protein